MALIDNVQLTFHIPYFENIKGILTPIPEKEVIIPIWGSLQNFHEIAQMKSRNLSDMEGFRWFFIKIYKPYQNIDTAFLKGTNLSRLPEKSWCIIRNRKFEVNGSQEWENDLIPYHRYNLRRIDGDNRI